MRDKVGRFPQGTADRSCFPLQNSIVGANVLYLQGMVGLLQKERKKKKKNQRKQKIITHEKYRETNDREKNLLIVEDKSSSWCYV